MCREIEIVCEWIDRDRESLCLCVKRKRECTLRDRVCGGKERIERERECSDIDRGCREN